MDIYNYKYDLLNIRGNITNNGNLDENKLAEAKRYDTGWSVVDSNIYSLPQQQTTLIEGLRYNIRGVVSGDYIDVGLFVDSSFKEIEDFQMWSLNKFGNLTWYYDNDWPLPTGITSSEVFRVAIKSHNNRQLGSPYRDFYDTFVQIRINTSFSINKPFQNADAYCVSSEENKTCYLDAYFGASTNHYWDINPLVAGTYNVTIITGNPQDEYQINRIITITD